MCRVYFLLGKLGGVSQVVLLPLPEALLLVRAGGGGSSGVGGGGGGGRTKQPVPLAPFDKFMRTSPKVRKHKRSSIA